VPGTLDAQFEAVELFPVKLVVGLRERHPLRDARSLHDLYAGEWILPGDDHRGREAVSPLFTPLGLPPPARIIQGQSVTVALGLVGHMDLIGLFVEPLVKLTFKRHGIRRIDVVETLPTLNVCVVRRRGQLSTPAAQHFIECIQRASAAAMGG
jgi:LysR family transcriptional regulator of abg operon